MQIRKFRSLLNRYTQGKTTPPEEHTLEVFFDHMQQRGTSADTIKNDLVLRNKLIQKIERRIHREKQLAIGLRVAAVICFLLLAAGTLYRLNFTEPRVPMLTVTAGASKQTFLLPDSSKVHLNAGSSLSFPEAFSTSERVVKLNGEAYFEVTHDEQRPFIVQSAMLTTRVLGTRFVVSNYPQELPTVTVVSGKVKVTGSSEETPVILTADQQAFTDMNGKGLKSKSVHATDFLSWTYEKIDLDHANIEAVIAVLSKQFHQQVKLQSASYPDCTISGSFSAASLEEVLENIGFVFGLTYERDSQGTYHISIKPCNMQKN